MDGLPQMGRSRRGDVHPAGGVGAAVPQGSEGPAESGALGPKESFVSCDGRTAVNTGPWWGADGVHHGYFTTVWQRTKAGWRWVYDGGDATTEGSATPVAVTVKVHRALVPDESARRADRNPAAADTQGSADHAGGRRQGTVGRWNSGLGLEGR